MPFRKYLLFIAVICVLPAYAITIRPEDGESLQLTIRRARNMHRLGERSTIRIDLGKRIYRLSKPLRLYPEDCHLIICGNGAEIRGSVLVKGWRQEGRFLVADAPMQGNRPLQIRQLWINGEKAARASQFGLYKMDRLIDFDPVDRTVTIPTPKNYALLKNAPQLEMIVHQRWAIAILRVASMEEQAGKTIVRFCEPEASLEFEHPWPQPIINGEYGSSSYCLTNALALADEPGEWYQDAASGKIYYYPKTGQTAANIEVEAPVTEQLVELCGSAATRVENVSFRGICFSYSAWNRPSVSGHVTLQGGFPLTEAYKLEKEGLPWNDRLENQAWTERPVAAVSTNYGRNVTFENCKFTHLSATALDFPIGNRRIRVNSCNFQDIGGTALMAGSFAEGATEVHRPYRVSADEEEYSDSISFCNNNINDVTNEDWGAVGIGCGYVRNTEISGNDVSDVNYSGICIGWGWTTDACGMRNNRIINNRVTRYAKMLYDAGGIYTLSYQPDSEISGNVVSEPSKAPYATNNRAFKLYLDDSSDGFLIKNNNFTKDEIGTNHPGTHIIYETN
jgi:hypothetical protein